MSELSNLIFHNKKHALTSPYGPRKVMNTSAGKTSGFHNGVDYGTYGVKLAQYPVGDGVVLSCGTDWAYGSVTVSPNIPEHEMYTEIMLRLIADEGKLLTINGTDTYPCIDVESDEGWYEVVAPKEEIIRGDADVEN